MGNAFLIFRTCAWCKTCGRSYRIRPNFRGAKFSRIALSKHFTETIFADQGFRIYGILKFSDIKFHRLLKSVKTVKIMCLQYLDVHSIAFLQVTYSFIIALGSLYQTLNYIPSRSALQYFPKVRRLITVGQLGLAMDSTIKLVPEDPPIQDVFHQMSVL